MDIYVIKQQILRDLFPDKENIITDRPGLIACDICGDCHDKDSIPLSCQSGDGI